MARTAFVRDQLFHRHNEHDRWHPENTGRLDAIERHVDRSEWKNEPPIELEARSVSEELILTNHSSQYFERIKGTDGRERTMLDPDTSASAYTYQAALKAAGAVTGLIDAVMDGEIDNGFAAIRPPGHHATNTRSMGFCIFNNVAIAARYLQSRYKLSRIAIVDFDVHHGNGTQDSFYSDPGILYISTHRYPFFPGTGDVDETGVGDGRGYSFNIPLSVHMGDTEYVTLFDRLICPVLETYKPEFLLISAGYDAHEDDPLGGMRMTTAGYRAIIHMMMQTMQEHVGHQRFVATLEGGYDLTALAKSVVHSLKVMKGEVNGAEAVEAALARPVLPVIDTISKKIIEQNKSFWNF